MGRGPAANAVNYRWFVGLAPFRPTAFRTTAFPVAAFRTTVYRAPALLALIVGVAIVATACTSGRSDSAAEPAADATTQPAQLQLIEGTSEIYCDGTEQLVGEVRGAAPGERLELSSAQPIQMSEALLDATADADGAYRLMWSCSPTEAGQPWELKVNGEQSGRWATVSFVGTAIDPDPDTSLQVTLLDDVFVCDGDARKLGELSNAKAFEQVTFTAEGADDMSDGTADANGRLELMWRCQPEEVDTWEVTATGLESGRGTQFIVVGADPPPDNTPPPVIRVDEDPFICDGASRLFAGLSGFEPFEVIEFSSSQATSLKAGQADEAGELPIRWTCEAGDAGTTWELTATGSRSRRTVSFTVNGAAPPPAPDPTVAFAESPFRCDGTTRQLAAISGFAPREYVDFTSPQAENLRQGQADEAGALEIRWTCDGADIDRVWEVTATGATSERSVSFQVVGAAP